MSSRLQLRRTMGVLLFLALWGFLLCFLRSGVFLASVWLLVHCFLFVFFFCFCFVCGVCGFYLSQVFCPLWYFLLLWALLINMPIGCSFLQLWCISMCAPFLAQLSLFFVFIFISSSFWFYLAWFLICLLFLFPYLTNCFCVKETNPVIFATFCFGTGIKMYWLGYVVLVCCGIYYAPEHSTLGQM